MILEIKKTLTEVEIRETGLGIEKTTYINHSAKTTSLKRTEHHRLVIYARSNFALKAVGSYPPDWVVFF